VLRGTLYTVDKENFELWMPLLIPVVDCVTSLRTVKLIEDHSLEISLDIEILPSDLVEFKASLHHFYIAAVTSMNRFFWLGIDVVRVLFIFSCSRILAVDHRTRMFKFVGPFSPFYIFPCVPINRLEDAFLFVEFS
jgi:hypothetical protein